MTDDTAREALAEAACRTAHATRWEYRATSSPCMECLFGYQRLMSPNTVIRCSACEQINENKPIIVLAVLP